MEDRKMNNLTGRPTISVVIPTYNRALSLEDTLNCLLNQKIRDTFDYEVIIVNNNSTDKTETMLKKYVTRFGNKLHCLFEPRQGKTFALNLGIKNASGSIITCVDDDCLFEEDYLSKVFQIFKEAGPDIGFIGGKILPHWLELPYPAWLQEFLPDQPLRSSNSDGLVQFFCGPLGILDYGDSPYIVDYAQPDHDQRYFYGANMSFRKSILDQFGYFNEHSILVEDTEICIRLLKAGVKARYSPELKIFHKTRARAIDAKFYYRNSYKKGVRREIVESYAVKPYHPFGIQVSFAKRTLELYWRSLFTKSYKQKLYLRSQTLFNVGQMIKIFKNNII
jgi:glycosyltransferase involved in cell wall biosynthesis